MYAVECFELRVLRSMRTFVRRLGLALYTMGIEDEVRGSRFDTLVSKRGDVRDTPEIWGRTDHSE